jgi:hypothetical protein
MSELKLCNRSGVSSGRSGLAPERTICSNSRGPGSPWFLCLLLPHDLLLLYTFLLFFFFCGSEIWTQGLHFEPLHQPFFCACVMGFSRYSLMNYLPRLASNHILLGSSDYRHEPLAPGSFLPFWCYTPWRPHHHWVILASELWTT